MDIQEIYNKYKLMPNLQLHQLRVATVGKIICDSIPNFKETKDVIGACLLHDMGNIIKFDLNYYPDFLKPKGFEYWQKIKEEYIQKYGKDEHIATQKIISELTDSKKIKEYADQVGFSKLQETKENSSLAKKICAYSDMRVGPHGIVSIEERVIDGKKRYEGREDKLMDLDQYEILTNALSEIEKQIFETSTILPTYITNDLINEKIIELKNFEI